MTCDDKRRKTLLVYKKKWPSDFFSKTENLQSKSKNVGMKFTKYNLKGNKYIYKKSQNWEYSVGTKKWKGS